MGAMTLGRAQLDLATLSSEAVDLEEEDLIAILSHYDVPMEINTRLIDLLHITRNIAGQVIHIGKIIIMKVIEFIREHPHTAIGMLLGAAFGALVSLIPWIGPLLAPITTALGAAYGAMVGSKMDHPGSQTPFEGLIALAKRFFEVLAEIFNILKSQLLAN